MFRVNPAVRFCWNAVCEGWLGDVSFIEADMNHCYGDDGYQRYVGTFKGGILYNLGCHLMDMIEPMTDGMPTGVHSVIGTASGDSPDCLNRTAAMLDYPKMNVLVRSCSRAGGGNLCRRLRIDGSNGTIDLCPIERFDGVRMALKMTLANPAGGYGAGDNEVDFGPQTDRYADQLRELARIVRGEAPNDPAQYDHDLKVHELTLRICGI
jgi:predicted dehydrogenase